MQVKMKKMAEQKFTPFKIVLTIETMEEAEDLYHLFNHASIPIGKLNDRAVRECIHEGVGGQDKIGGHYSEKNEEMIHSLKERGLV